MKFHQLLEDVFGEGLFYLHAIIVTVINTLFLSLWILTQYLVNRYVLVPLTVDRFAPLDLWQVGMFQIGFAITTIVFIGLKIWEDVVRMYRRTKERLNESNVMS